MEAMASSDPFPGPAKTSTQSVCVPSNRVNKNHVLQKPHKWAQYPRLNSDSFFGNPYPTFYYVSPILQQVSSPIGGIAISEIIMVEEEEFLLFLSGPEKAIPGTADTHIEREELQTRNGLARTHHHHVANRP